ncbi:MAG: CDP-alcohol phosphatidyltransferase family protein, partial [Actinomycetota bacterium]
RALANLPKLSDSKESGAPTSTLLKVMKAPFKILAVQRLFHSVEMTIIITIFGNSDALINLGLYLAFFVTAGHLVAILGSRKLDPR